MKKPRKNLVTAAASGVFALALLVALLSACGKQSHYDDCDALGLAAYEAPAQPGTRPAVRPVARSATTHHVVVHHTAPRLATTHHMVVHHVIHLVPAPTHHVVHHHVLHARPTHIVSHHHHDLC